MTYFCLWIFSFLSFLFFSFLGVSSFSWEDLDVHHELNFSLLMILFGASFWKKIYFGLKEGTMENLLIIWDEETWSYITLSLDCLIFREINSCNKFQRFPTLVIFLFLSFYCPIFCSDFSFVGFSIWRTLIIILFLNAFEEKRLRMKLLIWKLYLIPPVWCLFNFDNRYCGLLRWILSLPGWMNEGSKRFLRHMRANMFHLIKIN